MTTDTDAWREIHQRRLAQDTASDTAFLASLLLHLLHVEHFPGAPAATIQRLERIAGKPTTG